MGLRTLLLTLNLDTVAQMSCNPAVGGLGKGHLVREIDALGGEMAKVTDATGIQFRRLNTSKGPAVRATRAQSDKRRYRERMQQVVMSQPNLSLRQGEVEAVLTEPAGTRRRAIGVRTAVGDEIAARAVVLT